MPVRKLGNQGLQAACQGLGCMGMSAFYKDVTGQHTDEESIATIHRAKEIGVTFLGEASSCPAFAVYESPMSHPPRQCIAMPGLNCRVCSCHWVVDMDGSQHVEPPQGPVSRVLGWGDGDCQGVEAEADICRLCMFVYLPVAVLPADTSDIYGPFTNEELVGRAIKGVCRCKELQGPGNCRS